MQIALVAVVLLAGLWFTVLRPKDDTGSAAPTPAPTAPGVNGLTRAVDKAKGAATASDAANARIQKATGGSATGTPAAAKPAAAKATATKTAAKAAPVRKAAAAKPATTSAAKTDAPADPSHVLLGYLAKGKTVVLLFHGDGADDRAARKAVHRAAVKDKNIVAAYAPVTRVGRYEAITTGVEVTTAPTILVIGTDRKATTLTGFVDVDVVRQAVGDARRAAAAAKK
jgi:hypothetical protein